MEPVSLLLMALAKNPDMAASAAEAALRPGAVDVSKMKVSLVDTAKGILACYHRTARFRQVDVLGSPWNRAEQYGAERSAVIRIDFQGITTAPYQMIVAVMIKGNEVRSAVLEESTVIPYNKKCELEDWSSPK